MSEEDYYKWFQNYPNDCFGFPRKITAILAINGLLRKSECVSIKFRDVNVVNHADGDYISVTDVQRGNLY